MRSLYELRINKVSYLEHGYKQFRIVGGGVQTEPTRHVGHFWPMVSAPGDFNDGEFGGIKTGRGNQVLGENMPQRHFVHHKYHLTRPGHESGPPRGEASD
jgi:hypothetical protein